MTLATPHHLAAGATTDGSAPPTEYRLLFDGGCDPNPGAGYGSYRFEHVPSGRQLLETFAIDCGTVTNNQAEYLTLIAALHRLRHLLGEQVTTTALTIVGDSRLVLNQLDGTWGCNDTALGHLRAAAVHLLSPFATWATTWVPRADIVMTFGH